MAPKNGNGGGGNPGGGGGGNPGGGGGGGGNPGGGAGITIDGTNDADVRAGTLEDELIRGKGGNDTLFGGAGDDTLEGDQGNDILVASANDDILDGGADTDAVWYRAASRVSETEISFGSYYSIFGYSLQISAGTSTVLDTDVTDGNTGTDLLLDVESVWFSDGDADGDGVGSVLEIFLDGRNNSPLAVADYGLTFEDTPLIFGPTELVANDLEFDGETLTLVSVQNGVNGSAFLNADGSVEFTPDTNFSGEASFTYLVSDGSGGLDTQIVRISVTAVADAPTLAVNSASGEEDTAIALDITYALTDTDGSESLTFEVAGLPDGATLSDGVNSVTASAGTTSADITAWDLANLTITPPPDSDQDFQLTVTARTTEAANGDTAETVGTIDVTVNAVADAPILTTDVVQGATFTGASTDYAIVNPVNSTLPTDSYTLSFWMRDTETDAGTSGIAETYVSYGSGSGNANALVVFANPGGDLVLFVNNTGVPITEVGSSTPLSVPNDTAWRNLVLTVDVGTGAVEVFVDGALAGTGTGPASSLSAGGALVLGQEQDTVGGSFQAAQAYTGDLADVAFYDGILNPAQIASVSDASVNPEDASIFLRWNDATQSFEDISGGGNDITTFGALTTAPTEVSGDEDTAIALDITSALTDTDGSESLTLEVAGLPDGATLSDGVNNFTASAGATLTDITAWDLASLTILPPPDSDQDFQLTVTARSTEAANGDTAETVGTIDVTVTAVADAPTLTVNSASGEEDTAIALDITSALTDTDGSESLEVEIAGVPAGATLSAGTDLGGGLWRLTSAELTGLSITPPADSDADFQLTVTARSTEAANSDTAETIGTIDVTVTAVADAPTLTVNSASGEEDTAIALDITSALTDTDGSESLEVDISGVPAGATLSAGTDLGGGLWRLTSAELTGLSITPPADSDADFQLTVTARSTEAANGDTAETVQFLDVTVTAVADAPLLSTELVQGATFTGEITDYSIVNPVDSALPTGSYTLSFWIRDPETDASNFGGISETFLSYTTPAGGDELLIGALSDGRVYLLLADSATLFTDITTSDPVYVPNNISWHNLVVTYDAVSGTVELFIDGSLAGTGAMSGGGAIPGGKLVLGQEQDGPTGNFDSQQAYTGDLADVAFYDGILDSTQIASVADASINPEDASIFLRWNDATQSFKDISGGGNNMTTFGALTTAPQASGDEDTAIALDIAAALTDTDGSESLEVDISGIPAGATLSAGTDLGGGVWRLAPADLTGLTITPPADRDADFQLTVKARSTEAANGDTAETTDTIDVHVTAVADAPTLTVSPASGDEDTAIALDISAALTDTDGSESLTVEVSGIPEGATLSDGVNTFLSTSGATLVDVTSWDWASLAITPALNSDQDFQLTVTARSTEAANGDIAETSTTLDVSVTAVADAPTLSVNPASGDEDTAITLDITSALTDTDGSESLTLEVAGLPDGATLSDGVNSVTASAGTTSADITAWDLANLTITPPSDSDQDFQLTVTACSTEAANGDTAETVGTIDIAVSGINDAPVITSVPIGVIEYTELAGTTGSTTIFSFPGQVDFIDPDLNDIGHFTTISSVSVSGQTAGLPDEATLLTLITIDETIKLAGSATGSAIGSFSVEDRVFDYLSADQQVTLQYELTVHDGDGGSDIFAINPITVTGTNDAPLLSAIAARTGVEDIAQSFNFIDFLTVSDASDIDGSVAAFRVESVGDGALTLADSTSVTPGMLINTTQSMVWTPPENRDGQVTAFSVVAIDDAGGASATPIAVNIDLDAVADTPLLAVDPAFGAEDTAIVLEISSTLTDTDGSESLTLEVAGLPDSATLSDGVNSVTASAGTTSADITAWDLANLTITPPPDSDQDFQLTVTARTTEAANGDTAETVGTIDVTVNAVADAPILTTDVVQGATFTGASTDYAIVNPVNSTLPTDSYTLSFWMRDTETDAGTSGIAETYVSYGSGSGNANALVVFANPGGDLVLFVNNTGVPITEVGSSTPLSVPNDTAWRNLVLTVDVGTGAVEVFVDGALAGTGTGPASSLSAGGALVLGQEQDTVGGSFQAAQAYTGDLADVAFYDGILNPAQIASVSDASVNPEDASIFLRWNDATQSFEDISGGGNDITTFGALTTAPTEVSGDEDTAIALDITSALTDTDGSESLTLEVAGLPDGATLSDGVNNFTASAGATLTDITAWDLASLTILPPPDSDQDFQLTVTARSTEAANGDTAETVGTIDVTVTAVADAPTLVSAAVSGTAGEPVALDIQASLTDLDGSEELAVRIVGLPEGTTFSAGSLVAPGEWSFTGSELAGLTMTLPSNVTDVSYTIIARATEAGNGDAAETSVLLEGTLAPASSDPEFLAFANPSYEFIEQDGFGGVTEYAFSEQVSVSDADAGEDGLGIEVTGVTVLGNSERLPVGEDILGYFSVGDVFKDPAETIGEANVLFNASADVFEGLGEMEAVTFQYDLTLTDSTGAFSTTVFPDITITGTNDTPYTTIATLSGSLEEEIIFAASGDIELVDPDQNGAFDVDVELVSLFNDTNVDFPSFDFETALGSALTVVDLGVTNLDARSIRWELSLDNAQLQELSEALYEATYRLTITDDDGAVLEQNINIDIFGQDDPTEALPASGGDLGYTLGQVAEATSGTPEEGTLRSTSGTFNFTDIDLGDMFTARVQDQGFNQYGQFNLNFVGTPAGLVRDVSWSLDVADFAIDSLSEGETITQVYDVIIERQSGFGIDEVLIVPVTIEITGANDAPFVISDQTDTILEDETYTVATDTLLGNFTDVDTLDVLRVTGITNNSEFGQAVLDDGGTPGDPIDDQILFTPDPNYSGFVSFDYTVDDGSNAANSASFGTVFLEITPEADQFDFNPGDGQLLIENFADDQDLLDVRDFGLVDSSSLLVGASEGDLVIDFGSDDQIILVSGASVVIDDTDFLFI